MATNNKTLIEVLGKLRKRCAFENASFSDIKVGDFEMHFPQQGSSQEITKGVVESTRIYRETWILPVIDDLIAWAEGGKPLKEVARYL